MACSTNGSPPACMLMNDTLSQLGRDLSIEYAGAAGHLNVKQRLGKTQTEGPDLRHVCRNLLLFQGGFDSGNDFEPSGSLPGQAGADADPRAVAGSQTFPAAASLGQDGAKGGFCRCCHKPVADQCVGADARAEAILERALSGVMRPARWWLMAITGA